MVVPKLQGHPWEEKRPQFFLFHRSSNMKRAASLNYLNQPSAAPLQVRVVLVQSIVGEKERTNPVGRGESPGMKTLSGNWRWADRNQADNLLGVVTPRDTFGPEIAEIN